MFSTAFKTSLFSFFLLLTLAPVFLFAGGPKLKVGSKYVYEVDFNGSKYDFIVEVRSLEMGMKFKYLMTNDSRTGGMVSISPSALAEAHALNNYFTGGEMRLKDKTTVWVSQAVYTEFKAGSTSVNTGVGFETLTLKSTEKMVVSFRGKDKKVKALYGETDQGNKFWILDDEKNPLILKMDLGWTISIKGFH